MPSLARVIHSLEVLEETVLKRAEAELGHGIEIMERLDTAQIKRRKFRVFVQRLGQLTPLHQ